MCKSRSGGIAERVPITRNQPVVARAKRPVTGRRARRRGRRRHLKWLSRCLGVLYTRDGSVAGRWRGGHLVVEENTNFSRRATYIGRTTEIPAEVRAVAQHIITTRERTASSL